MFCISRASVASLITRTRALSRGFSGVSAMASTKLSASVVLHPATRIHLERESTLRPLVHFRSLNLALGFSNVRNYSFTPGFDGRFPGMVKAQAVEQESASWEDSDAAAPAPVEGSKLYVGNLPWDVKSATLAEIFQDAGVVEEVEVVCDRDTGRSRGFAFVVMSSPEEAQAAIERFDGSDLGGRLLRVNFPSPPGQRRQQTPGRQQQRRPGGFDRGDRGSFAPREESPNKVYVGNLSWSVDDASLQDLFKDFGRVLEARVVMDRETGRSRGFGFVTLSGQEEVQAAVSNLDGTDFDGRPLRVNPAGQKPTSSFR